MSSSVLKTRDGKIVKEIGTWEKEQLLKMGEYKPPPKKEIAKRKGRKPFDTKKRPNLYITRVVPKQFKPHWVVKIVFEGVKQPSRAFYDHKLGGTDSALLEARKHRDEELKKLIGGN